MEYDLMSYVLFFAVAVFSGFYGVIMGGAGFLNIPMMIFLFDVSPASAVATNIFGALFLTLIGGVKFYRQGKAHLKMAAFFAFFALLGVYLGVPILVEIDASLLKKIMAFSLVVCMILSFAISNKLGEMKVDLLRGRPIWLRYLLAAILLVPLGIYQGIVSAGYGTLLTYLPILIFGFGLKEAIGTARLHGVPMVIFSSLLMAEAGLINYQVGFVLMAGMAVGSYLGAGVALKMNAKLLQYVFAGMVLVNALLLLK